MIRRPFALAVVLLVCPTTACGQTPINPAHAREVAITVKRDCLAARSQAPNEAFAHHLDRLCECSYQKVAALPLTQDDDAHGDKVGKALRVCYSQLGGAADAEDYRATGLKPPAKPR